MRPVTKLLPLALFLAGPLTLHAQENLPPANNLPDIPEEGGAEETPSEPQLELRSLRYGGSGCPVGSINTSTGAELANGRLSIHWDEFMVELGPDTPLSGARKNCVISFDLAVPEGYQYALSEYKYRGFAALDPGVSSDVSISSYFEGGKSFPYSFRWTGPQESDFVISDFIGIDKKIWSPCGLKRAFNTNIALRLISNKKQNPDAKGLLLLDFTEPLAFRFELRRCSL